MNPFLREAPAGELICLYHLLPAHDVLGILNPSGRQKGGLYVDTQLSGTRPMGSVSIFE